MMAQTAVADALAAPAAERTLTGRVVLFMALAMLANYADRGSLAVAAPLLSHDLAIGPVGMGLLLSAFFWTYALAQPLAGMTAERWPVRWVLAGGLLAWSLSTMLCGLAGGFISLFALRMLTGLGESVIYPANARLLSEHAASHQRGQANGAIEAAKALGPMVGTLVGGLVLAHYGWRSVFWVLGTVSLLWLPGWLTTALPHAQASAANRGHAPDWRELLSQRTVWTIAIGAFCYAYPLFLLMTWLPSFLVGAEHFSLIQMAWIGAAIAICQALGAALSGIVSDRAIVAGHEEGPVRKRFMLAGMGGTGLMMLCAAIAPYGWVEICLGAAAFCIGLMCTAINSSVQTMAGPQAAGRWIGVVNLICNFSGVVAPLATGLVVAHTGSFRMAFLIPALLSLVGVLMWGPLTGPIRPVAWRRSGYPE
jgi:MFS family permease